MNGNEKPRRQVLLAALGLCIAGVAVSLLFLRRPPAPNPAKPLQVAVLAERRPGDEWAAVAIRFVSDRREAVAWCEKAAKAHGGECLPAEVADERQADSLFTGTPDGKKIYRLFAGEAGGLPVLSGNPPGQSGGKYEVTLRRASAP